MARIAKRISERIAKYRCGFFKRNTLLNDVCSRYRRIPSDLHIDILPSADQGRHLAPLQTTPAWKKMGRGRNDIPD